MSDYAMPPWEWRKLFGKKAKTSEPQGYAAEPGTGPVGETCGSCRHHAIRRLGKNYHKCELSIDRWTGGGKTDIRVRSPACRLWESLTSARVG